MSTFTPSGVRLIADGTESGTWGAVTNVNLQILNRLASEAGTVTLAGTSSTLIVSDGALSPGQYAVVVFGGAPSGTHTVTIDPNDAKRVFFIKNNTNQSVVMQQGDGSGGTVTIPTGQSRVVYCDGAGTAGAFVDVSSSFLPATLTAISALAPTDGNFIVGNGSTWVVESGNTALASLGLTATAAELNTLDGIPALSGNGGKAVVVNPGGTALTFQAFPEGTVYTAGSGLTLTDSTIFSHADTSSQASVDNSGTTVIQDVTLDTFGHVTALASKTIGLADFGLTATATELNYVDGVTSNIQTQINAIAASTPNNSTITISASTGLAGGGSFTLNQATNASISVAHADTSSQSSVNNSGNTFIQDITVDGFGHITAIGSGTVSIPAPTTTQVLDATAAATLGAVGTYAFAATSGEGGFAAGRTVSGSTLQYAGGGNDANSGNGSIFERSGTLSGTWRQMGYQKAYQTDVKATLWLRIS